MEFVVRKEGTNQMGEVHLRREEGAVLVEFAIIAPLLFVLLLGIIEFGIVFFSYNTIANAAREGARYGVVHPGDAAGIESAARTHTIGLNPGALEVSSATSGETVRVEVVYPVNLITGLIIEVVGGSPTLQLHATATMYLE